MSDKEYGPLSASEAAIDAAYACQGNVNRRLAAQIVNAAHDPALGLDRSVCLRDVIAFVQQSRVMPPVVRAMVCEQLAREFGGEGRANDR